MPRTGDLQERAFWPNSSQGENVGDPPFGILIGKRMGSLRLIGIIPAMGSSKLCTFGGVPAPNYILRERCRQTELQGPLSSKIAEEIRLGVPRSSWTPDAHICIMRCQNRHAPIGGCLIHPQTGQ